MRYYSEKFKKAVVKKALTPGVCLNEISRRLNINYSSLKKWKDMYAAQVQHEVVEVNVDLLLKDEEIDFEQLWTSSNERGTRPAPPASELVTPGRTPEEYTQRERCIIIRHMRSLDASATGQFLRSFGLQTDHITKWENEIFTMEHNIQSDKEIIRKLEQENKELRTKLKVAHMEKTEMEVFIELKKKYSPEWRENVEE